MSSGVLFRDESPNQQIENALSALEFNIFGCSAEQVSFSYDSFLSDFGFSVTLFLFYWAAFTTFFFILYMVSAWFGFHYFFDKSQLNHALFLKNQIWREIKLSCSTFLWTPPMAMLMWIPLRMGKSNLHCEADPSLAKELLNFILVIIFADAEVYWWHRFAHTPLLYKHVHKKHHQFVVPTPFASYAFHPLDSFMTGLPYMAGCYVIRMHLVTFVALLLFSHTSAFGVHEGYFDVCKPLQRILIGSEYHSGHHKFVMKNFGHVTTFWDVAFGTERFPLPEKSPQEFCLRKPKLLQRVKSADLPRPKKTEHFEKTKLCRKWSARVGDSSPHWPTNRRHQVM